MSCRMYLNVATVLLQEHGDRALLLAMQRALEMRGDGDDIGSQIWENVVDVLIELRSASIQTTAVLN